ncbi:MAG: hypothetical protein NC402_02125 [Prevotella sp.]|nr:hypothetical protein [Prevotella sp.]MCM1074320.1 hypothetical protein [Ruminococcus sp.]
MIKVGIIGGATPQAGELIRLLVNHPDVQLSQIYEPGLAGRDIKSVHHGLIGECALKFSEGINFNKLNVVFITEPQEVSGIKVPELTEVPELAVINMTADFNNTRREDSLVVYGVPEVNRKALVRGARRAVIPPAEEIIANIALLPLGLKSMLPAKLPIEIEVNDVLKSERTSFKNVSEAMHLIGNDPAPEIKVSYKPYDSQRVMRMRVEIDLPLPIDNITDMYEEIYDDHNLTYVVGESMPDKEVEGTDKCIITLDKTPDGRLSIEAVADARLRGGAGDAVHVMNLLMGLYEKTGLALRASTF